VTTWTFIWLILILKIPIVALFLIVRWAIGQTPESAAEEDGGIGPRPRPLHPHRVGGGGSRLPRMPRRGPHGEPSPLSPARVRTATARARLPHG
jgi:hypothetical protein